MAAAQIIYRTATAADLSGMARLRAEQYGEDTLQHWEQRIAGYLRGEINPQQALAPRVIYVAMDGETVVGFIAGHLTRRFGSDGELEWINVGVGYRGLDIAGALLAQLAGWFVGQQAYYICVNCAPENDAAQKFYRRHGAETLNEFWLVWKDISRWF
jgi:ribosomal protein S18 acetylase RimI-like enzyme